MIPSDNRSLLDPWAGGHIATWAGSGKERMEQVIIRSNKNLKSSQRGVQ